MNLCLFRQSPSMQKNFTAIARSSQSPQTTRVIDARTSDAIGRAKQLANALEGLG